MVEPAKPSRDARGDVTGTQREAGQATLVAIRDVSIAATDALGQVAPPSRTMRWLALAGFVFLVYIAGSVLAIYLLKSEAWVRAFVAPLPLVLVAVAAFWRRQVWKFRTSEWRLKEKTRRDALNSLAHETANAVNAIYANLAALRTSDPQHSTTGHLQQIDLALARIDAALEKVVLMLRAQPAGADADRTRETRKAA